VEISAS